MHLYREREHLYMWSRSTNHVRGVRPSLIWCLVREQRVTNSCKGKRFVAWFHKQRQNAMQKEAIWCLAPCQNKKTESDLKKGDLLLNRHITTKKQIVLKKVGLLYERSNSRPFFAGPECSGWQSREGSKFSVGNSVKASELWPFWFCGGRQRH